MKIGSRLTPILFLTAGLLLSLSGCNPNPSQSPALAAPAAPTSAPASPPASSPASAAAASTDRWLGTWNGPEGTSLRIVGGQGKYQVMVKNLDGPRTFQGSAGEIDEIRFERDGSKETIRASNGTQTGMKWLDGKKHCLTIRYGEGYCRD